MGRRESLVRVVTIAALGVLNPALLGRGIVRVRVRVEAVDWPTKTLEGVDDLLQSFSSPSPRLIHGKTTHIVDGDGLGLAVLDVGDTVFQNLLYHR